MNLKAIEKLIQKNSRRNAQTGLIITGVSLGVCLLIAAGIWTNILEIADHGKSLTVFYLFTGFILALFIFSLIRFVRPAKLSLQNIDTARIVYLFKKPPGAKQKTNLHANVFLSADGKKYSFPIERSRAEDLMLFLKKSGADVKVEESQIRRTVIT